MDAFVRAIVRRTLVKKVVLGQHEGTMTTRLALVPPPSERLFTVAIPMHHPLRFGEYIPETHVERSIQDELGTIRPGKAS